MAKDDATMIALNIPKVYCRIQGFTSSLKLRTCLKETCNFKFRLWRKVGNQIEVLGHPMK